MQILLGYFFFSVLLRIGATFQCIACHKEDATTCTTPLVSCNAGEESCMKRLSEEVKGGKTTTKVVMFCAPPSICNDQYIELSYDKGVYVRVKYDCCRTDACSHPDRKMPPLNTTVNKNRCPVCSLETGQCSDNALKCTGSATHCFESSLKDEKKRPIKGCTTESVCNALKVYEGPIVGETRLEGTTCKKATVDTGDTGDSSCPSLEVFLLALLPVKLFLFGAY